MEWLSAEFFSGLAAIVVIDLILAGDNAIVIALAARDLPEALQRRAVVWGTLGAIAVRAALTVAVVWVLRVPGLLFAGGAMLIWIAYRLLAPVGPSGETHVQATTGFWRAIRTIVVADAVMGLDNVLAVAGAAQGSYFLVILGLLISVPMVVWGSTLILRFVDRYPVILYAGGAVLAWTAAKMLTGEPLLADFLTERPALAWIAYLAVIGGVLGAGYWRNVRRTVLVRSRKQRVGIRP